MPGNIRTFKLANGGYADVPEENVDAWLQRMQSRGIGVSVPEISADMQVGEPEVIKSAAPDWGPDQEMGFRERFANGLKGYASDFAKAGEGLVRGLNQSLYQGGADEFAAAARAAGGEDFGAALKSEQGARDRAWDETPITYGAGRALGYIPGLFMGGPAGQGVKAALGRIGTQSGMGALNGFLSTDGGAEDRAQTAAIDAAGGALMSGAGELLQAGAPLMQKGGVALRRANAGGSQSELDAIRRTRGIDQMQTGVDKDFADLGLASSWKPQSAADVYCKLGPEEGQPGIMQSAGQQMGRAMDEAGELGVRGDWDSVRQSIDNSARAVTRGTPAPTVAQKAMQNELYRISGDELPPHITPQYDDFALPEPSPAVKQMTGEYLPPRAAPAGAPPPARDMAAAPQAYDYVPPTREMAAPPPSPMDDLLAPAPGYNPNAATPRELHTQKTAFEDIAYPKPGVMTTPPDELRASAYRTASAAPRAELEQAMAGAPLDQRLAFQQGNETYEKAAPLAAMAGKRAAANKAAGGFGNVWNYPLPLTGAAAGSPMGIPGMLGGAALGAAVQYGARNYGQDLAGIGMQATGAAMRGVGKAGGRLAAPVSGLTAPDTGTPAESNFSNGLPEGTRGYLTPDVAKEMLQQNPMAFGPYTQQFQQAMQDPDQSALVRLLDRLETTDDFWARQYLPQLQQRTSMGGQQ